MSSILKALKKLEDETAKGAAPAPESQLPSGIVDARRTLRRQALEQQKIRRIALLSVLVVAVGAMMWGALAWGPDLMKTSAPPVSEAVPAEKAVVIAPPPVANNAPKPAVAPEKTVAMSAPATETGPPVPQAAVKPPVIPATGSAIEKKSPVNETPADKLPKPAVAEKPDVHEKPRLSADLVPHQVGPPPVPSVRATVPEPPALPKKAEPAILNNVEKKQAPVSRKTTAVIPLEKPETAPVKIASAAPVTMKPAAPAKITPRLPDTETEPDAHSNVPEKSSVETGLEIQAIVWSDVPERRMAVVNGTIVRQQHDLGGTSIAYIGPDYIICRKGNDRWKLRFRLK